MTRRLVLVLTAAAVALSACGGEGRSVTSELGEDAPARVNGLSEIARSGLLFTDGEPLIDPTELVDAASFDGIPSVDDPVLLSRERAGELLVDAVVGGLPVAVTWCPLCNTGIAFDRRVGGRTEVFGVSGGLYRSALVMFDRRTTSLWPQPLAS